jgi:RNA polymerase sigma factor (sigma-70 family)
MTELEIIEAISSGEQQSMRDALTNLYKIYGPVWIRRFKKHGISEFEAHELLQDVILRIFKNAAKFTGDGLSDNTAGAWMSSIARNSINDYFRDKGRNIKDQSLDDENWNKTTDHNESIYKRSIEASNEEVNRSKEIQLNECVDQGVNTFCDEHPERGNILMMQMNGESIESIARRIGRTTNATKQYLYECRKKITPYLLNCKQYILEQ